jgi:hypothetical protein
MRSELEVLRDVCERLERAHIPYMLTGSFAAGYYARPRMTRDIDLVIELGVSEAAGLAALFEPEYLVPPDLPSLLKAPGMFNLLQLDSLHKIDFIVRKDEPYRIEEFSRRRRVSLGEFEVWIVSPEDLALSKLVWSRESRSELQRGDVRALLATTLDWNYLERWASALGVSEQLRELRP